MSRVMVAALIFVLLRGEALAKRRPAAATDPVAERECATAYEAAKESEQANHLMDAKASLLSCARAKCGTFLHHECTTKYTQLEADIPTIVPVVSDESGAPRVEVQVMLDGEQLASHLDGRAFPVDPGLHELSFVAGHKVFAKRSVMVVEGKRNRVIAVEWPSAPAKVPEQRSEAAATEHTSVEPERRAPEESASGKPAFEELASTKRIATKPSPRKVRLVIPDEPDGEETRAPLIAATDDHPGRQRSVAPAVILGVVGLAGLGGSALLTIWGRKDNDLLAQCTPNCPTASLDRVRKLYIAADVSLSVGLAATLAAASWALARSHTTTEESERRTASALGVLPVRAGAVGTFSRSF